MAADAVLAVRTELTRVRPAVLLAANAVYLAGTILTLPSGPFLRTIHGSPVQSSSVAGMNDAIFGMVATLAVISLVQIVTNTQALLRRPSGPHINTVHSGLRA